MPSITRSKDPNAPLVFNYVAVSPNGQRVKSKMAAPSAQAVTAALANDHWTVTSIKEVSTGGLSMDLGQSFGRSAKLSVSEVAEFARAFHQLLKAGLNVAGAIVALGEDAEPQVTMMCADVAQQVSSGVTLSDALGKYPRAFDEVFCSYIRAGEQSGTLVQTTARLAQMLEKQASIRKKVKAVTAYPMIVSIVISILVMGILWFLVPQYATIYAEMGAKLPGPTQALISISKYVIPFILWHVSVLSGVPLLHGLIVPNPVSPIYWLIMAFIAFRWWNARNKDNLTFGTRYDKVRFRTPIFGKLWRQMSLFRWASTLAGALDSGVPMEEALTLAANASGSRWQRKALEDMLLAVRTGRPLSSALATEENRKLYPANVRKMVETGEVAGELDQMLLSVADAISSDIDATVASLGAKIEVALIITMGIIVGGLLIVLYLPILNLDATIGNGYAKQSGTSGGF